MMQDYIVVDIKRKSARNELSSLVDDLPSSPTYVCFSLIIFLELIGIIWIYRSEMFDR